MRFAQNQRRETRKGKGKKGLDTTADSKKPMVGGGLFLRTVVANDSQPLTVYSRLQIGTLTTAGHFMANKKLKCNLHMASLSAVKLDGDLKAYYERKVAEGKNKMSVLNAVKCKLLARVVAVVTKGEKYVKKVA